MAEVPSMGEGAAIEDALKFLVTLLGLMALLRIAHKSD